MELTMVVLPTPGPPVMTSTLALSARRIASAWLSASVEPGPVLDPRQRLVRIDRRPGQLAVQQAQEPLGDHPLGPIQPGEKDARRLADAVGNDRTLRQFEIERRPDRCRPAHLEQLLGQRHQLARSAGRNGPRPWPRSAHSEMPARTRIIAVFSMPSFMAIASAVLKPMPRMSRARRYGFSLITWTASAP